MQHTTQSRSNAILLLTGAASCLWVTHSAAGQNNRSADTATADVREDHSKGVEFHVDGGFRHQFTSGIDTGARFEVDSVGAGIAALIDVSDAVDLNLRFRYDLDMYEFSEGHPFGLPEDPWETVHTVTAAAIVNYAASDEWRIFGGPIVQSARESGGDFGGSISGGAVIGATYTFSPDLTAGVGIGVYSPVDEGPNVYPILILDWHINEELHLVTRTGSGAFGQSGIELVWTLTESFDLAFGGGYSLTRFRLDDDGAVSGGVGEVNSTPLWARFTWHATPTLDVDFMAGIVAYGEIHLDSNQFTSTQDFDNTGFLGIYGRLRF